MSHIPRVKGISGPRRKYEKAPTDANDEFNRIDDYEIAMQTGAFDSRGQEMEFSVVSTTQTSEKQRSKINKTSTVIIVMFVLILLMAMKPNNVSTSSSEILDDELLPPLYDMEKICSMENIMTDDGRKLCERKCKASLCCFANGASSCFQENSFLCGKYASCQHLFVVIDNDLDDTIESEEEQEQIETDNVDIDEENNEKKPMIKPAPKNIQDLCSPINTETASGILECEAACEGGSCCWEGTCEENNMEECSNYEVCKNIGPSLSIVEKVKHACSVSKIGALSSSLTSDERVKNRYKCKELCDVRSCCFSKGVSNCYLDNSVWCDEFSVCKTLSNTDKDSPPTLPPTLVDVKVECIEGSLLSSSDYVKCQDSCMVASCCFSNEGCLKKGVNCDEFSGCKQFLQDGDVSSSTSNNNMFEENLQIDDNKVQHNDVISNNKPNDNEDDGFDDLENENEYGDFDDNESEYYDIEEYEIEDLEDNENEYGDDAKEYENEKFEDNESEYGDAVNENEYGDTDEYEIEEFEKESEFGDTDEYEIEEFEKESEFGDTDEYEIEDFEDEDEYEDDENTRDPDDNDEGGDDEYNEELEYEMLEYEETIDDKKSSNIDENKHSGEVLDDDIFYGMPLNEDGEEDVDKILEGGGFIGVPGSISSLVSPKELENICDPENFDDEKMVTACKEACEPALCCVGVGNEDCSISHPAACADFIACNPYWEVEGYQVRLFVSSNNPQTTDETDYVSKNEEDYTNEGYDDVNYDDEDFQNENGFERTPISKPATSDSKYNTAMPTMTPIIVSNSVPAHSPSLTGKTTPVSINSICSQQNLQNEDGYKYCVLQCNQALCCLGVGRDCSNSKHEWCSEFSACSSVWSSEEDIKIKQNISSAPTKTITKNPTSPPHYLPSSTVKTNNNIIAAKPITKICSDDNLRTQDGYDYCVLECNQALCCTGLGKDCSVSKKDWCEEFSVCSRVWNGKYSKPNEIKSEYLSEDETDDYLASNFGESVSFSSEYSAVVQDDDNHENEEKDFDDDNKSKPILNPSPPVATIPQSVNRPIPVKTICSNDSLADQEGYDYCVLECNQALCCIGIGQSCLESRKEWCMEFSVCNKVWSKDADDEILDMELINEQISINSEKQIDDFDDLFAEDYENDEESESDHSSRHPSPTYHEKHQTPMPTSLEENFSGARLPSSMVTKEEIIEAPNHLNSICSDANIYIAKQFDDCIVECNKALCCVGVGEDCSESKSTWCSSYSACNKVWFPHDV